MALNTTRVNAVLLAILLAVQLLLMTGSARDASGSAGPEALVLRVSSPVVAIAEAVGGGLRGLVGGVRDLFAARARNRVLSADLRKLAADVKRYREMEQENRRLRNLLGMTEDLAPQSIAASVVTANLDGGDKMIVVDRGEADGVRPYMPVVAWGGAVGRVVVVARKHAKVRLLSDPNSGVAAVVQRSRAKGIVLGGPAGTLDLHYVARFSDVMHGDRVVTSGLDGIFPRGFGVGRVSSITQAPDGAQTIHLEGELDYGALEEVLIVLGPVTDAMPESTGPEGP